MVFEDYHEGLNWLAEGYKHKLFANDAKKSLEVLPQDDSFALLPSEKTDTYAGIRIKSPTVLNKHGARSRTNRPVTAPPRFGGAKPERPWSSRSYRSTASRSSAGTPSPHPPNQPRIRSAGSSADRHRAAAHMRSTFTLVNKLYEDCTRRQNINLHPASPAPDYRYFDRHSRCFDYTHMHDILLHDRPQTACNQEPCSLHSRPVSAMSNFSRVSNHTEEEIDTMKQPKRYINYHRPRTAPSMRTDVGNLQRRTLGFQGSRPRFCNIVRSMQIHSRDARDMSPCTGDSGFDEFDYITRDGRLINRWRKDSGTSKVRNALDAWLSLGQDEFGNRVNFRPNYTFGLFSSIPERPETKQDDLSKHAGTGLDGKPGTPTSIEEDLDRMELDNTGLLEDENSKMTSTDNDYNKLSIPDDIDKDDIGAGETPTQPPSTPEIAVRVEIKRTPSPPSLEPVKKKTCITKKTLEKKPINKAKKKGEMEKPAEVPVREPTPPPPPEVVAEKKEPEVKVNLQEPSLPDVTEKPHKQKKEKLKPEKFAIPKHDKPKAEDDTLFDETLSNQLKKFELMVSDMASPEETPRKHTNKPLKITGRLALSQQSSRFTLPMDMRELETMSTKDYVLLYCKITKRRQHLYDNVYRQTVGAITKPLHYKELEKALRNVLVDTLNNEHFKYICELLEIKEGEDINAELFAKMAALAERLLYPQYVTKETEDHKDYQKELIEVADFSALEWKFHGVNVRPEIQKLLKTLC